MVKLQRIKENCETMWSKASEEVKAVYGQDYFYLPYALNKKSGVAGSAQNPKPVLDAVEDALLNANPKSRYLVDGGFFDIFSVSMMLTLLQRHILIILDSDYSFILNL